MSGLPEYARTPLLAVGGDRQESVPWVPEVRRWGLSGLRCIVWGDRTGYQRLLDGRAPLALLDLPSPRPLADLVRRVRALSLVAPVVVIASPDIDHAALLEAGAVNVHDRDGGARSLATRVRADLRWLGVLEAPEEPPQDDTLDPADTREERKPAFRSQALLLDILCMAGRPLCCHELRLLLGDPRGPMSLPALRGRMNRLQPFLAARGLECRRTTSWGQDVYALTLPSALPA